MASYYSLYGGGDPISSNEHLIVYLYPNTGSEDSECENQVATAIDSACSKLLSNNAVGYYEVNINYDHPNQPDSSKSEFQDGFFNWLDTAGDYRDYVGCHVGVASGYDHAGGEAHDGRGDTAFSKAVGADVGIGGAEGRWMNFAVQEPMHTFINAGLDRVKQLCTPSCTGGFCVSHEHDLGQIGSNGAVTPLATLYEDSHAEHGDCALPYTWGGNYNYTITDCTVDAIRYTANDEV